MSVGGAEGRELVRFLWRRWIARQLDHLAGACALGEILEIGILSLRFVVTGSGCHSEEFAWIFD